MLIKSGAHPVMTGTQDIHQFDNGYGASVVRFNGSYGASDGLYELAVLTFEGKGWGICYDTPITSDVEGHLTPEDVADLLAKIEALPARKPVA